MGVEISRLLEFAEAVIIEAGADQKDAVSLSRILLWSDAVARTEQGVERLPILCRRLAKGLIKSPFRPVWSESGGAVARLDAADGLGHLAAEMAAHKAVELAGEFGIGAVTVAESNYFGSAGYYAWLIAEAGMIGIVASNSFPKVAAWGGVKAVLGTNPFAFAAPIAGEHPVLLDMATGAVAGSEIRRRAAAGLPLDPGMVVDAKGNAILDPNRFDEGVVLPFGGPRGFGVMILVEMLSGVLSGGAIGAEVKSMYKDWSNYNRSTHFVLALAPDKFLPDGSFGERMKSLAQMLTASGPDVRLPGAARWAYYEKSMANGIEKDHLPIAELQRLGDQYGVSTEFLGS